LLVAVVVELVEATVPLEVPVDKVAVVLVA
jgi:hypothetical protein